MSLDVYLRGPIKKVACSCPCCGNAHTREKHEEYYSGNITHNLNVMAEAAGIYKAVWRPEEIGITKAHQLIIPLKEGLAKLKDNPAKFKAFNPTNGWGNYEQLVEFLRDYISACEKYKEADVYACR